MKQQTKEIEYNVTLKGQDSLEKRYQSLSFVRCVFSNGKKHLYFSTVEWPPFTENYVLPSSYSHGSGFLRAHELLRRNLYKLEVNNTHFITYP